jgi:hypothetical protein
VVAARNRAVRLEVQSDLQRFRANFRELHPGPRLAAFPTLFLIKLIDATKLMKNAKGLDGTFALLPKVLDTR